MTEHWKTEDFSVVKENIVPITIKEMEGIKNSIQFLIAGS